MSEQLKGKAIKSIKWNAFSIGSELSLQVTRTIVLARLLEPRDYGLMGMLLVIMGFVDAFSDVGISGAIIHKQNNSRSTLSSLFWLNIFAGSVIYALLWILTPVIVAYYREPILSDLSHVLFLSVLFRSLGRQFETLLSKDLRFKSIAFTDITSAASSLFVGIFLASHGYGVWSLVWSQLTQIGLKSILQFTLCFREFRPNFHFRWTEIKPYLGFGLFSLASSNILYISQRADQAIMARFLGSTPLGYYSFAYQFVLLPTQKINPILTRVAFPVFAQIQNDTEKLRDWYLKLVYSLSLVNAIVLLFVGILANDFVPIFFGEKWLPAVGLLQALSLLAYVRSLGNPIGSIMLAKGRTDLAFYQNLALMLMNVPAVYFGVKYWGAIGAVGGLLFVQAIIWIPAYFFVLRRLIGPCGWAFIRVASLPLIAASSAGIISLSIFQWLIPLDNHWMRLIILIPFTLMVYFTMLRLLDPLVFTRIRQYLKKRSSTGSKSQE